MSLAGTSFSQSQARALEAAFFNDVLPVAAAGNHGDSGNPLEFPAALIGGLRGGRGIGLSVGATMPNGQAAAFSTHNPFVSLAAPGSERRRLPLRRVLDAPGHDRALDDRGRLPRHARRPRRRALRLRRGHELRRADRLRARRARVAGQARGSPPSRWGRCSRARPPAAAGTSSPAPAWPTACAPWRSRASTTCSPRARGRVCAGTATGCACRLRRSPDRTGRGDELAGHVTYGLLVSRDGGNSLLRAREPQAPALHQERADPRPPSERAREHRLRRERQLRREAARALPPPRLADRR